MIVPLEWMPDCKMARIIVHWTAGAYAVSKTDKEHYHIIVAGNYELIRGDNSIQSNVSTSDSDGYAAHTKGCNSGSIGIAAACMAGAVESPFDPGAFPLLREQWIALAEVASDLCKQYHLEVGPKTVLQHGEVQKNLGIVQEGKWDICKLPWAPTIGAREVCNGFRGEVSRML